ncbi:MAG: hypothetical protein NWQ53_10425, partial [Flavobacteriales bacterium]|nr:hypothetical protein [Flavobacteriales bacterium]
SKTMKKAAKTEYEKTIGDLERKNIAMKEKIIAYQDKGAADWENFMDDFNRDMNELGNSLEDLNEAKMNN